MANDAVGCDNCGDSTPFNPKVDNGLMYKKGSSSIGQIKDPVQEEVKDIDRAKLAYYVLPIIPFFDNSDATLLVLRKLSALAPTEGSCINSIGDYVIGGGLIAIDKTRPGVSVARSTRKSEEEEEEIWDTIESWHPDMTTEYLIEQAESLYKNESIFGNQTLHVKWYKIGGKKYMICESIDTENWRYWATYKNEPKIAVLSDVWTLDYIQRFPPQFIGVWPNITENDDGEFETIIHRKNKVPGRPFYGLPRSHQAIYYKYWEYQLGSYGTQGYANQWSARVFLETSGDNVEVTEISEFRDNLQDVFTFEGEGKRVLHRHKNAADDPTKVHEFQDEKSHEFHQTTADIAENNIIKAHNWHRTLMGVPSPGKLGSNNEFTDIYDVKNLTVIKPRQISTMRPFNIMLSIAREWFEEEYNFNLSLGDLFDKEDDEDDNNVGENDE